MTNCLDCEQVITNPLCPNCVSLAVSQWISFKKIDVGLQDFEGGETCIKCSKEFNICTYCFSEDLLELVTDKEQFIEYFSFDLDKKGYNKISG